MTSHAQNVGYVPLESHTPANTASVLQINNQPSPQSEQNSQNEGDIRSLLRRKMFVGGLSNDIKEEDMKKYFSQFGQVVKTEVIKSGEGKSRGFGFVTFTEENVVQKLLGREHVIESRKLDCKSALLPGTKGEGVTFHPAKLFVGGISSDTTPEVLIDYFTQFGTISRAEVMYDHITDKSRGFGFVVFEHQRYVQNVVSRGNFHLINGRYCEVKQAVPRQVAQRVSQPMWGIVPAPVVSNSNSGRRQQHQHQQQQTASPAVTQQQQQVGSMPLMYVPYVPVAGTDMMYPYFMYSPAMLPTAASAAAAAVSQPLPHLRNNPRNTRSQNSLP